jgi:uncharacterized protein (DUF885 family)
MPATDAQPAAWIAQSNAHAQVVLDNLARFNPEIGSLFGVPGSDERVIDLGPRIEERQLESSRALLADLETRLAAEKDAHVRQDLEIMLDLTRRGIERTVATTKLLLPYDNVPETIFRGMHTLLIVQNPPERQRLGLARLRRYAGLEPGGAPVLEDAAARWREKAGDAQLLGPAKAEVEKHLADQAALVGGIAPLFDAAGIADYKEALAALEAQIQAYETFVRGEVLARARAEFRQPGELYRIGLKDVGVDMPIEELASRALVAFKEIQNEMNALAPLIAREQGIAASDYREVLRALKAKQLTGDAILPHYQARMKELEAIIRREKIVSLPAREAQIRLASAGETAAQPAPHMQPPRLIGNTGERGTFVLPLQMTASPGQKALAYDDFTFEAASWTLTAHEGRPGHELQFAAIVEQGVSIARALFAFNSVNVEGWALYMEAEAKPYEPLDGQLAALQHRLLRAARAFLDPGVQAGTISPEEATRVLTEDVVVSPAMARQETERYMFRAPGQATSYFLGYQRLMELRAEVERALGARFDRQRYHDFLLSQGLLPPSLLRRAVMEEFVART